MATGLKVWDDSTPAKIRLDTTDRAMRYAYFFSGTLAANSSVTLTATGLTTDGTWMVNAHRYEPYPDLASVTIGTNQITMSNTTGSTVYYEYGVFRI
jgi:hypothetical protein